MDATTYTLVEGIDLWQVKQDGSLLAGFVERELAEEFLIRQVDLSCLGTRPCEVEVQTRAGARVKWRYSGQGDHGRAWLM